MLMEQTSRLPFIDKSPIRVQMRIYADRCGYMADMNADWSNWHRFRIGIKPGDLEELNASLQHAVEDFSGNYKKGCLEHEALAKLAQTGSYAFKRIFATGLPREIVSHMLQTNATIQVSSEDFFIPWELLYDGPLGAQTDVACFWGMRSIISRALIQDARPGAFASPAILTTCPHVGLITCNDLEYVSQEEIPTLQKLHEKKKILLLPLRPLNADLRDEELTYLESFFDDEDLHVIHFACHALQKKPLNTSYLLISDDFSISIEDFIARELEMKHKPLVFLNACLTGTMSPLSSSNWAALFWEHGARGVLATEFHVPDWFAAAFTKELYQHLLAGKPIGEGLFATRHHFWREQQNPLGLAYALYSSPSVRIVSSAPTAS